MLVKILVLLLAGDVLCQYHHITHPLGAISYISNTHFQQPVDYRYIAPTGQAVNVKYATSAAIKPHQPQNSAVPQYNSAPSFVFHSAPADLPQQPHYPFYQPQFFQQDFRPVRPVLPSPESLFLPSNGVGPAHTRKQFQAYKDYLKEIAEEDAKAAVTEAQRFDEYQPEGLFNVDIGEK